MVFRKTLKFFFVSIFAMSAAFACAQTSKSAGRKTAVRYLKLAEHYSSEKNWNAVASNAALGLSYDENIADLWYIRSLAAAGGGQKKSEALAFIQRAFSGCEWVDYNKDSARILYADMLCATRKFEEALEVLDAQPFIYSADAEFIRIKCFYSLNLRETARDKIDSVRRIYPDDARFARLFFQFEYSFGGASEENSKLARTFINSVLKGGIFDDDTEILSSAFSSGEERRRMIQSFNARGKKSPFYPLLALDENLISEKAALEYFYSFADDAVDFGILKSFSSKLKEESSVEEFAAYLNSYDGTLFFDLDGDLTWNLKVQYERGRPEKIFYDENQDDDFEWEVSCDFGVPVELLLQEGVLLSYSDWPSVSKAEYILSENETPDRITFRLVPDFLIWTPFAINSEPEIRRKFGVEFFVPEVKSVVETVTPWRLLSACSGYSIPSKERENALIKVSVLDGKPQIARYYAGDTMYAQTYFEDGVPKFRACDADGDGLFETTEVYEFNSDKNQTLLSAEEEIQIVENLFGFGEKDTGVCLKMIQIDNNGDTVPDFTEEYFENFGKVSSWDFDSDGVCDYLYEKLPENGGVLRERAVFYQNGGNTSVEVYMEDGIPKSVSENKKIIPVQKDKKFDLYWLGEAGTEYLAEKLLKKVNPNSVQGVSYIADIPPKRVLGVRVGKFVFARILPEQEEELEKIEYDEEK